MYVMKGKYLEAHNLLGQMFDEPSPERLTDIVEQIIDLDIIKAEVIRPHLNFLKNNLSDQNMYDFLIDIIVDQLVLVLYNSPD